MISVVIPTLNEEENLGNLLTILDTQLDEGDDVIVVDSHSDDATREIARDHGAQVHEMGREGIGKARTVGARQSDQPYVAFLDADTVPSKGWVSRAKTHLRSGADGATGLGLYDSGGFRGLLYNTFSGAVFLSGRLNYLLTGTPYMIENNVAIDRELFLDAGGYRSVVAESVDLGNRLRGRGREFVYDSGMRVLYSSRRFEDIGFLRTVYLWTLATIYLQIGKEIDSEEYSKWRTE